jgi:hypothetical protein
MRPVPSAHAARIQAMSLALAIQNRLAVCALVLMLVPHWISVPTLVRAARAEELPQVEVVRGDAPIRVVSLGELRQTMGHAQLEPAYGALHHGGTVVLHEAVWDARPSDDRADRPYVKPDWPWPPR